MMHWKMGCDSRRIPHGKRNLPVVRKDCYSVVKVERLKHVRQAWKTHLLRVLDFPYYFFQLVFRWGVLSETFFSFGKSHLIGLSRLRTRVERPTSSVASEYKIIRLIGSQ